MKRILLLLVLTISGYLSYSQDVLTNNIDFNPESVSEKNFAKCIVHENKLGNNYYLERIKQYLSNSYTSDAISYMIGLLSTRKVYREVFYKAFRLAAENKYQLIAGLHYMKMNIEYAQNLAKYIYLKYDIR